MDEISNLFRAYANGFRDTMAGQYGGSVGFRIPEYQREYNWGEENIGRLLENIRNGLNYLTVPNNDESYTFLGTLILVFGQWKRGLIRWLFCRSCGWPTAPHNLGFNRLLSD